MNSSVTCPACGAEASLNRKFDAWAHYAIVGVDPKGQLAQAQEFDTQVFDHSEIECSKCGEKFDEEEVIDHLSGLRA